MIKMEMNDLMKRLKKAKKKVSFCFHLKLVRSLANS